VKEDSKKGLEKEKKRLRKIQKAKESEQRLEKDAKVCTNKGTTERGRKIDKRDKKRTGERERK
jgi:hypothetical protein